MPPSSRPPLDRFDRILEDPERARSWLASLGVHDPDRGFRDLVDMASRGGSGRLPARFLARLDAVLPACPDPGMALTNLERFAAADDGAEAGSSLDRLADDPRAIEIAVQLFSTSQFFGDLLIRDPALLGWLRSDPGRREPSALLEALRAELDGLDAEEARRLALRRFRLRELIRIGYNDIIGDIPNELTTLDLAHLADACIEAATRSALRQVEGRLGRPTTLDGRAARFVVLALGKLGGEELNYSSDIDLIFVYDEEGQTEKGPRPVSNAEFFARAGGEIVRTLSEHTSLGVAYRVDMRLRPEGERGPLARSLGATLDYYASMGRTWERQALIKCRAVAGDLDLGAEFLGAITPFVYRRYLGGAEIGEIKAMKRRIEQRTASSGLEEVEVKTGRGGIRDVEFVVQFLQLLHGGEYPEVRHPNTTIALSKLEAVGCLTAEERGIMVDTYRFLRRVEHRLQTMFDLQTHEMPRDLEDQRTLAIRLGYAPASFWEDRTGPAGRFLHDYRTKTEKNRAILDHLLHDAFPGDGGPVDPVVDLVLDPSPTDDVIARALGPHPFVDKPTAYHNLMALAREESPFLSQARCRHFLAGIAPRLLDAVGRAPDPDMALTNLEKVSASLGAKAMLWELFNHNPPTLKLYVDLCSTSQFLSEILINNPGMIDDLMDSLVVNRPVPASAIVGELAELCRGAEDLGPILSSFRNKEWVRIGTREILRREPVHDVTRELSDVAEAIVVEAANHQWKARARRFGVPRRASDGRGSSWAILALGKLGGAELNYHGDLDLVFVYDEDGATSGGLGQGSVSNAQFYADVARQTLRMLDGSAKGSGGPLYAVDVRLRPHGSSGPLAIPLASFVEYFEVPAQPWERLALTRARVIRARGPMKRRAESAIRRSLRRPIDPDRLAREVVAMRRRLEESRGPRDLKRGRGGLADVEFLTQFLLLKHADAVAEIEANTRSAIEILARNGILPRADADDLRDAYDFMRSVEGRLRLVYNRATFHWPDHPDEVARLARHLRYDSAVPGDAARAFETDAARITSRVRELFRAYVGT